jgi:hypothetical protein
MVKPESQAQQLNHRTHSADRRLSEETEANGISDVKDSQSFVAVEYKSVPKCSNPEDLESDFLKCYSNFLGTELTEKTTWKSENFSQKYSEYSAEKITPSELPPSSKSSLIRHLNPSKISLK